MHTSLLNTVAARIAPLQCLADNTCPDQDASMTDDPTSRPSPKSYRPGDHARQARHSAIAESSNRKMSRGRRAWYSMLVLLLRGFLRIIWSSCRIQPVIGAEHLQEQIDAGKPVLPVYWHQMHLFSSYYLLRQVRNGLKVGFLVSPSVTGEVPAAIVRRWGAAVIRGSATRSGGRALRDMYELIVKQGISLVTTVDGPKGPVHKFKAGAILLARMTKAPLIPVVYAAEHCSYWGSWDRFIVPWPFSRIAIVIGEPVYVPANLSTGQIPQLQEQLEEIMAELTARAHSSFN
jgi:lysophospholipid acyltransferase (LPLAT)-like uncharacterized protein